ncbi:MAG: 3-phosphoshikimate 1-carboxyvinyltransferase, partial [Sarcina sp.]
MKKVQIKPSFLKGTVNVPTSKSYAHRALICAALCREKVFIKNISMSEDIKATLNCLKELGVKFSVYQKDSNLDILVDGRSIFLLKDKNISIYCNESGSTLRFMLPIVSMLGEKIVIKGKESLMSRPLNVYENIFLQQKLFYKKNNNEVQLKGPLKNTTYNIQGNISSQFLTGLFFVLPILNGDSKIIINTELQSEAYV